MGGGDKARITIGGVTILQRVLACLKPQCIGLVINANGDPARFADTKLAVDQPSSLFGSYENADVAAVGLELDALLVGLVELLGGEVPGQLRNRAS